MYNVITTSKSSHQDHGAYSTQIIGIHEVSVIELGGCARVQSREMENEVDGLVFEVFVVRVCWHDTLATKRFPRSIGEGSGWVVVIRTKMCHASVRVAGSQTTQKLEVRFCSGKHQGTVWIFIADIFRVRVRRGWLILHPIVRVEVAGMVVFLIRAHNLWSVVVTGSRRRLRKTLT